MGMGGPVNEMGGPSSSAVGGPSGSQVMNMQQEVMAGGSSGFGMRSSHQGQLDVGLVGHPMCLILVPFLFFPPPFV